MSVIELLGKGQFKKIDKDFIKEGHESLLNLSQVQDKFQKPDTDTFINELRDSMVGNILGFEEINTSKHGFDCRNKNGVYLEVKNASYSAQSWQATFNDTTYEKALAFQSNNLFLALSIWDKASELLFIVFGKNPEIGKYLKERIDVFKSGAVVRSTQSISYTKLINDYGFKIITKNKTKREILNIIKEKNFSFGNTLKEIDIYFAEEVNSTK